MTIHLNKLFSIALSASFLCGQIATGQSSGSSMITSSWKTFNRNNYSVKYPADWDLQQSDNSESGTVVNKTVRSQFAVLSQLESPQDRFRENVNLVIEDLNGQKLNLDEYSRVADSQLKLIPHSASLSDRKTIKTKPWDRSDFILNNQRLLRMCSRPPKTARKLRKNSLNR
jgi:hypothetical protein